MSSRSTWEVPIDLGTMADSREESFSPTASWQTDTEGSVDDDMDFEVGDWTNGNISSHVVFGRLEADGLYSSRLNLPSHRPATKMMKWKARRRFISMPRKGDCKLRTAKR